MTRLALVQPLREGLAQIAAFLARIKTALLWSFAILVWLGTLAAFAVWIRDAGRNYTIDALTHNHDVAVAQDAATKLVFARAYFLAAHRRLDAAQMLVSLFDLRGSDKERAALHYDLGNARLLAAFEKIESANYDAAGALVGLAEEDYIEAMRLNPELWDARYNFDVAARLVRKYPSFVNTPDLQRQGPRPIWTELPNVPRGEP
jgi:mxaK protein